MKYIKNPILIVLGWICVLLGVIGAALPILPTTPFIILAAYLFSKSSPKFHRWMLGIPLFGKIIRDWENNRVISVKSKVLATTMIVLILVNILIFGKMVIAIKILITIILSSVLVFINTRSSQRI